MLKKRQNMPPQIVSDSNSSTQTTSKSDTTYRNTAIQENLTSNNGLKDDVIKVDNIIYSTEQLASTHPGGELFVKAFGGRDATEAFLSYHRRAFPHEKMSYAKLDVTNTKLKADGVDDEYLELCNIVDQVLPRHKSFAPLSYYLKIFTLLTFTVGLELYVHYFKEYSYKYTAILGFTYALIGLNVQHDANHGAISKNSNVNRILGLTQNYIGGSAVDWIHQHVVQHHIHTNDVHDDPDITGNDVLRLNPIKEMLPHQVWQHVYIFALIALFGFTTVVSAAEALISGVRYTPMSSLIKSYRSFELLGSIAFVSRWVVLPLFSQVNEGNYFNFMALLNTAPLYMVAGYYLAFFFILSHNFEGVNFYDNAKSEKGSSFLRNQVASSSNVGGSWLCFMNGGLNYQIEHHLFPRIQHTHYPVIAPVVRAFCESKGIPYVHFPTVIDNALSTAKHLSTMSTYDKLPQGGMTTE